MFKQIIASHWAGGWRKLKREDDSQAARQGTPPRQTAIAVMGRAEPLPAGLLADEAVQWIVGPVA